MPMMPIASIRLSRRAFKRLKCSLLINVIYQLAEGATKLCHQQLRGEGSKLVPPDGRV